MGHKHKPYLSFVTKHTCEESLGLKNKGSILCMFFFSNIFCFGNIASEPVQCASDKLTPLNIVIISFTENIVFLKCLLLVWHVLVLVLQKFYCLRKKNLVLQAFLWKKIGLVLDGRWFLYEQILNFNTFVTENHRTLPSCLYIHILCRFSTNCIALSWNLRFSRGFWGTLPKIEKSNKVPEGPHGFPAEDAVGHHRWAG
jgi:hypothetical protein